jgi:hypothetical protein
VPPMLQITLHLPHDPDTEAKIGRLVTTVLAMEGRVIDIYPARAPHPALPPASPMDLSDLGDTPPLTSKASRATRAGNSS